MDPTDTRNANFVRRSGKEPVADPADPTKAEDSKRRINQYMQRNRVAPAAEAAAEDHEVHFWLAVLLYFPLFLRSCCWLRLLFLSRLIVSGNYQVQHNRRDANPDWLQIGTDPDWRPQWSRKHYRRRAAQEEAAGSVMGAASSVRQTDRVQVAKTVSDTAAVDAVQMPSAAPSLPQASGRSSLSCSEPSSYQPQQSELLYCYGLYQLHTITRGSQ